MPVKCANVDLLWKRVEDAKLQLDNCHNYIREIKQDKAAGALPIADGNLAYRHALRAEELATKAYLRAMSDFRAALVVENPPESTSPAVTVDAENGDDFGIYKRRSNNRPRSAA